MIHIDQDSDYVPKRLIDRSAAIIVAVIVVSIGATIALAGGRVVEVLHVARERPPRIDTTLFELPSEAEQLRARGEQHLRSYGWANRANGTIYVPLEVAIDQYLGAQR